MKFRNLRADEVEARVSQVTEKGVSLLIYKDARCDMRILDETVGPENWQREHYECKGNLFCRVGINVAYENLDDIPIWVWKSDCGTESNTEAQKGEASDSFKRACFNWGIGRELYTAPFIWIPASLVEIKTGKNGKPACYDRFEVTKLEIQDGKITSLEICLKGKSVYSSGEKSSFEKPKVSNTKREDIPAVCEICGKAQKGMKDGKGVFHTGKELVEAWGGKCLACHRGGKS